MRNNNTPSWGHDELIHAWWVIPGQVLAGEYPGAKDPGKAKEKIQALLDAGITSFVDLTEAGERTWDGTPMVPYDDDLPVAYRRLPIRDTGVTTDAGYDRILDHIRAEIERKAHHRVPDTDEQDEVLRRRATKGEADHD